MTVDQALHELLRTSAEVTHAVIIDSDGVVESSTGSEADEAVGIASSRLWEATARNAHAYGESIVDQLLVDTPDGALAAVSDGVRTIIALTSPRPSSGLVFYDLRTCLANAGAEEGSS